mgnify:CR=1 FL=1
MIGIKIYLFCLQYRSDIYTSCIAKYVLLTTGGVSLPVLGRHSRIDWQNVCVTAIKNFPGRCIRTDMSDGNMDREEGFYILRKFWCPAVLTENFFMDSKSDLEYLQSRASMQAVVDTHVDGIVEWLDSSV